MKLSSILFLTFSFSTICCFAQNQDTIKPDGGFYNTIQFSAEEPMIIIPQIWLNIDGCVIEVRYNYEDTKTVSFYWGKIFSFNKNIDWEIAPVLGIVLGKTNGVSSGFNLQLEYGRFSTFNQCQYIINNNSFWDWTWFNINISKYFGMGAALQYFQTFPDKPFYMVGPLLRFQHKSFAIETYAYNFWLSQPIWAIGFEYTFDISKKSDKQLKE